MDLLADAVSQGAMPAIVVAIYLLAVKLIDGRKERLQSKLNSDLVDSITKIGNFITYITENIVSTHVQRCEIAIANTFNCAAYSLTRFVVDTLVYNNIENNRHNIVANTKSLITNEYYRIKIDLDMYEIRGNKLSNYLKEEWVDEIQDDILDIVYNENLDREQKILRFSNKIGIKFQSYINYVITSIKSINLNNEN